MDWVKFLVSAIVGLVSFKDVYVMHDCYHYILNILFTCSYCAKIYRLLLWVQLKCPRLIFGSFSLFSLRLLVTVQRHISR